MNVSTTQRTCPTCGEAVRSTAKFCPKCGATLPQLPQQPQKKFCTVCGQQIPADSTFCPHCGTKTGAGAAQNSMPAQNSVPTPPQPVISTAAVPPQSSVPSAAPNTAVGWFPQTNRLHDLCSCYASLALAICLTASLLLQLLPQFSVFRLISNLPSILFCIGCWICYSGGRKQALTTSGFGLLSGTLMLQLVLNCIGFGLGAVIGLVLIAADEDVRTLGVIILIVCAICLFLIGKYWTELRKTVKSARDVLQNGYGKIATGMYSIVILVIGVAASAISLLVNAAVSTSVMALQRTINSVGSELPYETRSIYNTLISAFFPQSNTLGMLGQLFSVAVPILAVMILLKLHKNEKVWVASNN